MKTKKSIRWYWLLLLIQSLLSVCVVHRPTFAQAGQPSINQQIYSYSKRSPEAEAISKFTEMPVSIHTGVPEISVPVYTIELPGFSLPLGISYHAAGIRVEDLATDVGLGWSLYGGGAITQIRYGMNDFLADRGWLHTSQKTLPGSYDTYFINNGIGALLTPQFSFAANAALNLIDTQADLFSYSIPGQSGKFYFNQSGKAFFIPKIQNRISYSSIPGSDSTAFLTITDDQANRYEFGAIETSRIIPFGGHGTAHAALSWAVGSGWLAANDYDYTYRLSRIITRNNDTINYTYYSVTMAYDNLPSQVRFSRPDPLSPALADANSLSSTIIGQQRIQEITTNRGTKVSFVYDGTARLDVPSSGTPFNAALKSIKVYYNNELVKEQQFTQDYFTTTGTGTDAYKLRLLSTKEVGKPGYTFTYQGNSVPSWRSYNRDHWGFANASSNTTLLPADLLHGFSTGANREVASIATVEIGILKEILYPTGGKTVFQYENNDCRFTESKQQSVQVTRKALSAPGEVTTVHITIPVDATQLRSTWKGPVVTGSEYVRLTNDSTNVTVNYDGTSPVNGQLERLAPGTYTIEVFEESPGDNGYFFQLRWGTTTYKDTVYNKVVGGLRIRSVKTYANPYDATPSISKFYEYKNFDNPSLSSGVKGFVPKYDYLSRQFVELAGTGGVDTYIAQVGNSILPISIFQGGVVAYNNIKVTEDTLGATGVTRYYYTNLAYAKGFEEYPFTPFSYRDWKGGRMDQMVQTGKNGATEFNVNKSKNTYYTQDKDDSTEVLSMAWGLEYIWEQLPAPFPPNYHVNFKISPFYHYSGESRIAREQTVGFSSTNPADSIITTTDYYYDNVKHAYPTRVVTTLDNRTISIKTRYPQDYDTTLITNNAHKGINYLVNRNSLTTPIERYTQIKKIGVTDSITTDAVLNYYRRDKLLIDSIQVLSSAAPINNFIPTSIVSGSISKNANYKTEAVATRYDDKGNVLEQWTKGRRQVESFVWDYNQQFVVAHVQGALYDDIAYTSFEANGKGNWTFAGAPISNATIPTGLKCYNLATGAITKPVTTTAVYTVTYWTNNTSALTISGTQSGYPVKIASSNGWNCYEHKITGVSSLSISGTGYIDELRLHPFNVQMRTTTYKPLVGVTAECDGRNGIRYYDYDSLNRLKVIRDQNGKIIQQFDYRLQATAAQ